MVRTSAPGHFFILRRLSLHSEKGPTAEKTIGGRAGLSFTAVAAGSPLAPGTLALDAVLAVRLFAAGLADAGATQGG